MEGVKTGIEEVLGTQYLLNTPMGFHAIPRIPILTDLTQKSVTLTITKTKTIKKSLSFRFTFPSLHWTVTLK
jgi:hypothetical protein